MDICTRVIGLGILNIDFGEKFKLNMIIQFLGLGIASEGQGIGLEIDFGFLDIRRADCKGHVIAFCVACGRALSPDDCGWWVSYAEMGKVY